ncbi:FAD-binding protein [Halosquirtibacter laminarini]|uniref:FAD-binding protein n=1 Tax=Halosquirtibacter laminarini TaxID=3374600 RepID=A0AC61NGX7_9BACT|nr:FAD-binding protein [Prolixibacteraceae bacterium]
MRKDINITATPKQASDVRSLYPEIAKKLNIDKKRICDIIVRRSSIDARRSNIKVNLSLLVDIDQKELPPKRPSFSYPDVSSSPSVIIVGAGPAGMFAALRLIELGLKPIVLERGKDVYDRKEDISAIHNKHIVHPDSNYGFGEGGAGTFSDGKLYTRSKKRGDVRRILEIFNFHGAQDEILIEAHPHIGTNVLPKVVMKMRESILHAGGEVHFGTKVVDFILEKDYMKGVVLNDGKELFANAVLLATGHSARDIYYTLYEKGVELEPKAFAMGVRLEHPQEVIDHIQYHGKDRGEYLPAASYSFVEQVKDRGVYSFCMCPGGIVVPAATAPDELVVNGMSPSSRGGKFANAGLVVEIHPEDLGNTSDPLVGLKYQERLEKLCFEEAGRTQNAPAQRMIDFVLGKASTTIPKSSYRPGLTPSRLDQWLPENISSRLRRGFELMGRRAKGFLTNDAKIIGVESRTSSPVRIPRDMDTLSHIRVKNFYPCGEGAGYAGGIVSSAMDGERCAEMIAQRLKG